MDPDIKPDILIDICIYDRIVKGDKMLELLLKLEMSLWINETRFNGEYLDKVLHPEFKEFGRSGKTYNKIDIISSKEDDIKAIFPFEKLEVKQLDKTAFLITYVSVIKDNDKLIKSNRSSIWVGETSFQMIFHQGTAIE